MGTIATLDENGNPVTLPTTQADDDARAAQTPSDAELRAERRARLDDEAATQTDVLNLWKALEAKSTLAEADLDADTLRRLKDHDSSRADAGRT